MRALSVFKMGVALSDRDSRAYSSGSVVVLSLGDGIVLSSEM